MIDPATVIQVGGLVGSFITAAFYAAQKISNEAQKTRATVVKEVKANYSAIQGGFDHLNERFYKDLETRQAESFVAFQKLHSIRYSELNEIVAASLKAQAERDAMYRSQIDLLRDSQAKLTKQVEGLYEEIDGLIEVRLRKVSQNRDTSQLD